MRIIFAMAAIIVLMGGLGVQVDIHKHQTAGGWRKYEGNPVLGGELGTCFDMSVLRGSQGYRMWFSWRPKRSIALVESTDGIRWSLPRIVLPPRPESGWEKEVNRPVVLQRNGKYFMWYTGQTDDRSFIGYAVSDDGVHWDRPTSRPVLESELSWEGVAVMCPHVLWDEKKSEYRMWYSAGQQWEPDAIGYATSPDGINWFKHANNPVFYPDQQNKWEKHKVTGACVVPYDGGYAMFFIGFSNMRNAQIGLAWSKNGITGWRRHQANPIIHPGNGWDRDAVYKPAVVFDGSKWLLWYNGRTATCEQIGLAVHPGKDLGF